MNLAIYEMYPGVVSGGRSVGFTPPFPTNARSPEILAVAIDGNDGRHTRQIAVLAQYTDNLSHQGYYLFWNLKSGPDGMLGTADDTSYAFTVPAYPNAGDWIYSFEFRNNVFVVTGVIGAVSGAGGAYTARFCP